MVSHFPGHLTPLATSTSNPDLQARARKAGVRVRAARILNPLNEQSPPDWLERRERRLKMVAGKTERCAKQNGLAPHL